jgi:DNA-binding NarL/FixJ family response regulator
VLVGAAGGEELPLIPGAWRAVGHELLVRCYLELGRQQDAVRVMGFAQATAARVSLPIATAWAERAAAAVALDAEEPAAAAKHALSSADSAERIGAVVEEALSRTLAGRALAEAGDANRAEAELSRAAAALDACGATRYRDAAEQELRKRGHRIHRQTRATDPRGTGISSLTERELEVARLVVDRKTNAEIAAELFLSVKTIETHMRNLFRKLDVSSRTEVARTIERADRTTNT